MARLFDDVRDVIFQEMMQKERTNGILKMQVVPNVSTSLFETWSYVWRVMVFLNGRGGRKWAYLAETCSSFFEKLYLVEMRCMRPRLEVCY